MTAVRDYALLNTIRRTTKWYKVVLAVSFVGVLLAFYRAFTFVSPHGYDASRPLLVGMAVMGTCAVAQALFDYDRGVLKGFLYWIGELLVMVLGGATLGDAASLGWVYLGASAVIAIVYGLNKLQIRLNDDSR